MRGQFASLKASATGASAVVAATADQLVVQSAGGGALLLSNVNVTASVAAAAGLNGVDTGATAANTWYAMWVVSNGTATGMVLSLSATAPVLPAGMSHMARIGWIRTDGSGSKFPLGFIQEDKRVQWRVAPGTNMTGSRIMASGAAGDVNALPYIAVSIAAFVSPTAYAIQGSLNAHAGNDGGAVVVPNNNYGLRTSTTNPPLVFSYGSPGLVGNICLFDFAIEVANVYWASRGASILICTGYTEK